MSRRGRRCIVGPASIRSTRRTGGTGRATRPAKFVATGPARRIWPSRIGPTRDAGEHGAHRHDPGRRDQQILTRPSRRGCARPMNSASNGSRPRSSARGRFRPSRTASDQPASSPVRSWRWTAATWLNEPSVIGRHARVPGSYPRSSCAHPWFGSVADSGADPPLTHLRRLSASCRAALRAAWFPSTLKHQHVFSLSSRAP